MFWKLSLLCSYLPVYLWKHSLKLQGKDEFLELLSLLSMKQRLQEADFNTSKVLILVILVW